MTIFLSDMETCFAYMLLLPVGHSLMQDSRSIVWYMTVSNRDAATSRGIAVGEFLEKSNWIFTAVPILSTLIIVGSMGIYAITVTIL